MQFINVIQTMHTYQHKSLLFIPCAEIWLTMFPVAHRPIRSPSNPMCKNSPLHTSPHAIMNPPHGPLPALARTLFGYVVKFNQMLNYILTQVPRSWLLFPCFWLRGLEKWNLAADLHTATEREPPAHVSGCCRDVSPGQPLIHVFFSLSLRPCNPLNEP